MTWSRSLAVGTPLLLALLLVPAPAARASDSGPWAAPVPVVDVVRAFDPPRTAYGGGHRGVDLRAAPGTVVRAAGAGRVSYASVLAGRGVVVVVHGALRTTYEPVSATARVGEQVAAGDPLGTLDAAHPGHPSCAPAACLHWGLRRGDDYLDPLRLLRRLPSVLLPLDGRDRSLARGSLVAGGPAASREAPAVARRLAASAPQPVVGASAEAPAALPDRQPVAGDGWSLRSADLPLGAGALLTLVAGLALLTRRPQPGPTPDPDPEDPPVAPAVSLSGPLADHGLVAATPRSARPDNSMIGERAGVPGPVDLAAERVRRRAA